MYNRAIYRFVCSETEPVVTTHAGKVRGYLVNDIYTFHGIRYAQAERFQMPRPVTWEGIADAQDYGYICPPTHDTEIFGDITAPHRYWLQSEHCQYLNIWTQELNPQAKKPVVVWLHGGGFVSGSAIELECYDGENMARYGDVVCVSLNHRLNILGYLDLSDYGEEYANSGIVGMEDIVMALKWVRDNIDQFGGDPDNVTIMGESGGGAKVRALLQMSSADGLYHRAIIQSGILPGNASITPEDEKREAKDTAHRIVEAIGGLDALLSAPYEELLRAMKKVEAERPIAWGSIPWTPVPLTGSYVGEWCNAGFRKETLSIPVIAGSVFCELARYTNLKDKSAMTEEERYEALVAEYGAEFAPQIRDAFRKAYPELNLYYASVVDTFVRRPTRQFAVERTAAGGADTYNFLFAHETRFKGGLMSTHADDLPFVFHNAEYIGAMFAGDQTYKAQDEIFYAFMAFARSGNPNHSGIPAWHPVTPQKPQCFIFSRKPSCRVDHDAELIRLAAAHATTCRGFAPPQPNHP